MQSSTQTRIGDSLNRIDGPAKVTGQARYAGEHTTPDLLYGWIASSAIPRGRVLAVHDDAARAVEGVVEIITHRNRPHVAWFDVSYKDQVSNPGSPFRPLYDSEIHFSGQPLALVVAETLEAARHAASLVSFEYEETNFNTDFEKALPESFEPWRKRSSFSGPKNRGDADGAFESASLQVAGEYHMPAHYHNPMEPHAATAIWSPDGLTVYDKTQGSQNVQSYLVSVFGLDAEKVRVLNPYVGGAFGSGLRPQYQVFLAVLAAKMLERSVRVTMTRQQMFTHVHRPRVVQSIKLGASADGSLSAIVNEAVGATSRNENYMEIVVNWGLMAYACENARGEYRLAPLDTSTPGDMRAPGAATGMTLFEMAMDEMAAAANMDPLQFRLVNYTDIDAMNGTPWTSKALRECYEEGARAFGWEARSAAPRSMRDGSELVGWGMATGMWDAMYTKSSARVRLTANGECEVALAASDIGTGTYTILAQIAADSLGLPIDRIHVKIGDSSLPMAPIQGGSWTAASCGTAVQIACRSVGKKLLAAERRRQNSRLAQLEDDEIVFEDGALRSATNADLRVPIGEIMSVAALETVEAEGEAATGLAEKISEMRKSRNVHSAVFAEVKIDEELAVVRVTRIVIACAAGRIINPKTARSQILGGVVMGVGMALHEEAFMDHRFGRPMNHNFAEYHVPVNADIHDVEIIFVHEPDTEVNPLGVKGVGELGIVSTAAAIANAIYHATGKRVRDLPITIDKLID